jgi:hypothetical protein
MPPVAVTVCIKLAMHLRQRVRVGVRNELSIGKLERSFQVASAGSDLRPLRLGFEIDRNLHPLTGAQWFSVD